MDDKTRELIESVLKAAGNAGTQGWGYLVKWEFANAVAALASNCLVALGAAFLIVKLWRWDVGDDCDSDIKRIGKGIAIAILAGLLLVDLGFIPNNFRDMAQPEGAAIYDALNHK